jgi:toxin ParE1/3/4
MRVKYRPAARADLVAIAIYTKREWGTDKAGEYLKQLRAFASSLSEFPQRFPRHVSRLGSFRKANCGEHLIFYVVKAGTVEIVRVLHNRIDVDALLA